MVAGPALPASSPRMRRPGLWEDLFADDTQEVGVWVDTWLCGASKDQVVPRVWNYGHCGSCPIRSRIPNTRGCYSSRASTCSEEELPSQSFVGWEQWSDTEWCFLEAPQQLGPQSSRHRMSAMGVTSQPPPTHTQALLHEHWGPERGSLP